MLEQKCRVETSCKKKTPNGMVLVLLLSLSSSLSDLHQPHLCPAYQAEMPAYLWYICECVALVVHCSYCQ